MRSFTKDAAPSRNRDPAKTGKQRKTEEKPGIEEKPAPLSEATKAATADGKRPIEDAYALGTQMIVAKTLTIERAVDDVSSAYELNREEVQAEFERRVAAATPKPTAAAASEEDAKRALAARLVEEAVELEEMAAEATAEAKKARLRADAALADAENRVLVSVPNSFTLRIRRDNGTVDEHHIKAGSTTLPREQAEHSYSKANGVKVLGLPAEQAAPAGA